MKLNYTSPQAEVIEIELEGTLCASVEDIENNGSFGDYIFEE